MIKYHINHASASLRWGDLSKTMPNIDPTLGSLAIWFKPTGLNGGALGYGWIWEYWTKEDEWIGLFRYDTGTKLYLRHKANAVTKDVILTQANDSAWHLLICDWDTTSGTAALRVAHGYLDDAAPVTVTSLGAGFSTNLATSWMGVHNRDYGGVGDWYLNNCQISAIAVYTKVLSTAEREAMFDTKADLPVIAGNTAFVYNFNEAQGNYIVDGYEDIVGYLVNPDWQEGDQKITETDTPLLESFVYGETRVYGNTGRLRRILITHV